MDIVLILIAVVCLIPSMIIRRNDRTILGFLLIAYASLGMAFLVQTSSF